MSRLLRIEFAHYSLYLALLAGGGRQKARPDPLLRDIGDDSLSGRWERVKAVWALDADIASTQRAYNIEIGESKYNRLYNREQFTTLLSRLSKIEGFTDTYGKSDEIIRTLDSRGKSYAK